MGQQQAPKDSDEDQVGQHRRSSDAFAPADCRDKNMKSLDHGVDDKDTSHDASGLTEDMMAGVPIETPCVNPGCDDDDEEVANHQWTNEELHEAAALPLYDVSSSEDGQS